MAIEYFSNVFQVSNVDNNIQMEDEIKMVLARHNFELTKDLEFEEFTNTVKQMHPRQNIWA